MRVSGDLLDGPRKRETARSLLLQKLRMCYSPERFRPVFSINYFLYDSINCTTTLLDHGWGQSRPQGFSLKNGWGWHPSFKRKALGTRSGRGMNLRKSPRVNMAPEVAVSVRMVSVKKA